jgi:hypothetical protein
LIIKIGVFVPFLSNLTSHLHFPSLPLASPTHYHHP